MFESKKEKGTRSRRPSTAAILGLSLSLLFSHEMTAFAASLFEEADCTDFHPPVKGLAHVVDRERRRRRRRQRLHLHPRPVPGFRPRLDPERRPPPPPEFHPR